MGKGVYLVEAAHNDRIAHTVIIISDLAFITKKSLDNFLLYATHRTTGKPEPQVKFVIYNDKQYITGGTKDGVLILKLTEEVTTTEGNAKIMAVKGEDFTISSDWFYSYYRGESLKKKVYIYTERPVYRPGQIVYFKAILREIVEDTYKIPDPAVIYPIVIKDPKGTEIYNKTHAIHEYGSLFGEFQLADKPKTILDATTGPDGSVTVSYTPQHNSYLEITATATDSKGNQTQTTHHVYVYKKGFYYHESTEGKQGFSVIPDKNSYKVGDTARLFITSPVPDATVLLTTEGTSIYTHQILQLKGSLGLAEIKIAERYEPNVFVNAELRQETENYTHILIKPESAIPKSSELKLTFSPSLTASMYAALPYLLGYPYGCVEQVMGRFLPMVFVNDILKDLGIQNSSLTADIAKYFKVGSQRLYELQHPDGGWGWWEEDEFHPYMTAYVVYGLTKARQAGLQVQQQVIERGLHSLKEQLKKEKDPTTQLFMLQALSLVNQEDRNLVMKIYGNRNVGKGLSPYAKAILALLLGKDGNKSGIIGLSPLQTVLQEIRDMKIEEGTWIHWEGQEFHYTWQNDSIETTAYALRALVAGYENSKTRQNAISPRLEQNSLLPYLRGDEELIGKASRWALTQRTGNYWR